MKIFGIITATFLMATIGMAISFKMTTGQKWQEVNGRVLKSEVRVIDRQQVGLDSDPARFDYEAVIEYEYLIEGEYHRSIQVFSSLPAIFSKRKLADDLVNRYPAGAQVIVFYDPLRIDSCCLVPIKMGRGMFVFMVFIVVLVVAMLAVAFFIKKGKSTL